MSVIAPKQTAVRRSPRRGETADERDALIQTLRATLIWAGVDESRSDAEAGFHFVEIATGEISVEYHHIDAGGPLASMVSRRTEAAFLQCCSELAASDYAFTFFASPRTVALHITLD